MDTRINGLYQGLITFVVFAEYTEQGIGWATIAAQDPMLNVVRREEQYAHLVLHAAEEVAYLLDRVSDTECDDGMNHNHIVKVDPERKPLLACGEDSRVHELQGVAQLQVVLVSSGLVHLLVGHTAVPGVEKCAAKNIHRLLQFRCDFLR